MGHIKGKKSFEDFPEKGAYHSRYKCCLCMDLDLGDKFIQGEENKESQGKRNKVLNQKIINKRDNFGINVISHDCACFYRPMYHCPDSSYRKRNQHDDPDDEHNQVFHDAIVKKGFLVCGLEYKIYRIYQVGKKETRCDERTG